jgi:hypothetical protein
MRMTEGGQAVIPILSDRKYNFPWQCAISGTLSEEQSRKLYDQPSTTQVAVEPLDPALQGVAATSRRRNRWKPPLLVPCDSSFD